MLSRFLWAVVLRQSSIVSTLECYICSWLLPIEEVVMMNVLSLMWNRLTYTENLLKIQKIIQQNTEKNGGWQPCIMAPEYLYVATFRCSYLLSLLDVFLWLKCLDFAWIVVPWIIKQLWFFSRSMGVLWPVFEIVSDRRTRSGPLFTKKTLSYGYRDPHYKPKTVVRPSQVYNGNPYTDKTASS